tara:strand:+ start:1292 stop:1609 length:318 start_codon:yes stop_codon:yes gene_type:complete
MSEEKRLTMSQLEDDFHEELEDNKSEILEAKYPEDIIHEKADSWVPVYNYDRLQLACDHLWLGYPSENGFTKEFDNAYEIIGYNIYERLLNIGYEWLEHAQKEAV